MVERAGWSLVDQRDTSQEYAEVAWRGLNAYQSRLSALSRVIGEADLTSRIERMRNYLRAIEDGVLRRALFVAEYPG